MATQQSHVCARSWRHCPDEQVHIQWEESRLTKRTAGEVKLLTDTAIAGVTACHYHVKGSKYS